MAPPPPQKKKKTHTHRHHHQKCYTFYFVCVFKTDKVFMCSSINNQECYHVFLNLVKHELPVYFDLLCHFLRTQLISFIYVLWIHKKIITENSAQFYEFWASYGWTSNLVATLGEGIPCRASSETQEQSGELAGNGATKASEHFRPCLKTFVVPLLPTGLTAPGSPWIA